jgi:hypothetical protein
VGSTAVDYRDHDREMDTDVEGGGTCEAGAG